MHCSGCPSHAFTCPRSTFASPAQPVVRCLFIARFALPTLRSLALAVLRCPRWSRGQEAAILAKGDEQNPIQKLLGAPQNETGLDVRVRPAQARQSAPPRESILGVQLDGHVACDLLRVLNERVEMRRPVDGDHPALHAGANSVSYQQASRDPARLSDLKVAPKPVERTARKIGQERTDQRNAAAESHKRLPPHGQGCCSPIFAEA
jgi:hypothetical protein